MNTKGNYAYPSWVSTESRNSTKKSHFRKTFMKYAKLYCKYTKLAGFKYFVDEETSWFDRFLLLLAYAFTVPALIYTIYGGYLDVMQNPCFSSVDTEYLPTQELDFPGVSICSINRISRQAALEMANEVFQLNITRLSVDEILDMFLQLGDLYDSDLMRHDRTYRIDQLLAQFYGGYYDITAIMKRLTPDCTKLLQRCLFHNEERTCSEIFQFRKTQDGFCCTFNYATKGDDLLLRHGFDHKLDPLKVEYLGEDRGLVVLMDLSINDYFYPIFPITGCKVNIFNPHDYPDVSSGGVIEILVSPTRQVKVAVEAIVAYSTPNILAYSLEHRYCVFSEEMESVRSSYTYSDCIVDCRIADILRLCKCVPFFLPNRESKRVCDLDDVPCLTKHKYKWYSVVPNTDLYDGEIQESDEVLHCKNCYPLCNDVNYNAKMSDTYLPRAQHTSKILNGMKFENQSVLYVYFSSFGTIKLRQDVVYRWYELLGDASGIGGIFLGFSLIAVVEFAYFVGLFVLELLKGPDSSDRAKDESGRKRAAIQTIYWGELYPRTRPGVIADQRDRRRDKD